MEASVSEFDSVGDILILPLFEGVERAPNNALTGLSRTQRSLVNDCLLYTSPSPRDVEESRMPSSA